MDFTTLEAFIALAETLSFTRASEQLYISQSALSRQILRLEEELGTELFRRSRREVELTACGQVFLEDSRSLLEGYRQALLHQEDAKQGLRGGLTLGFLRDAPSDQLAEIIRRFRESHSLLRLQLLEYSQDGVAEALLTGRADLVFSFAEGLEELDGVRVLTLAEHPMCAVVRRDDPIASLPAVSIETLARRELVIISPKESELGRQSVMRQFMNRGHVPRVAAYADIVPSLLMLVESGVGIGTLPGSAMRLAPASLAFVPIDDGRPPMQTVLVWQQDNPNPALNTFLDCARSAIGGE